MVNNFCEDVVTSTDLYKYFIVIHELPITLKHNELPQIVAKKTITVIVWQENVHLLCLE